MTIYKVKGKFIATSSISLGFGSKEPIIFQSKPQLAFINTHFWHPETLRRGLILRDLQAGPVRQPKGFVHLIRDVIWRFPKPSPFGAARGNGKQSVVVSE